MTSWLASSKKNKTTPLPQRLARRSAPAQRRCWDILLVLIGGIDHIVDQLKRRREALGISHATVQADQCESFAPVVERLAGS